MFYEIPSSLRSEISELENLIAQFQSGSLNPTAFKAHRVPFGVYEQRTDNTYMVRVRCPAGAITPRQLRTVAEISRDLAADTIHITTRQELQLHNVDLAKVQPIMLRLLEAGLSTRGGGGNTVRNITASFDSGIAKDEVFDVSPYAFALTSRLVSEPDSWLLPRKYKIAFSNSAQDNARAVLNDLGFIALIRDGQKGFAVYAAGGMGGKPEVGHLLHEFIDDSEVYLVAEAIKQLFNKYGNRKQRHAARLRFLWNSLGQEKFLELYQQELTALRKQGVRPLELPPAAARLTPPQIAAASSNSKNFQLWCERFVAEQRQEGLFSVLIPITLGNLSVEAAISLADFLIPFGEDVLRATIEQNICLRNVPQKFLGNVYTLVKSISPQSSLPRILGSAVACTGASTCKLGVCLPRGALTAISKALETSSLDLDKLGDFRLNLSGCSNTCGAHMSADLGFYGKVARQGETSYPSYGVVAAARIGQDSALLAQPLGTVSARDLPRFVVEALTLYLQSLANYSSFADYFDAQGKQELLTLCQQYRAIPSFEDDKNYYYDWGSNEIFSLAGRGVGECSAGLFDLIELDLKRIKTLRQELEVIAPENRPEKSLYEIALCAARMLLITRGIEAGSEADVFSHFKQHFLERGLVGAEYLPLVEAAGRKNLQQVQAMQQSVFTLAQTMEELYAKMDNSLHFPGEQAETPKTRASEAAERDFRGVPCPMNFVKTKLALDGLTAGQKLKILLDDGAPIQNVPRSVVDEGHKVEQQYKIENYWAVIIKKC